MYCITYSTLYKTYINIILYAIILRTSISESELLHRGEG